MTRTPVSERDFTMARVAAARVRLQAAVDQADDFLALCVCPDGDKKGKKRSAALEAIDDLCGAAAASVQLAQLSWAKSDPLEMEPNEEEGEGEDEEDDEEDEEDEDEE